MRGFNWFEGLNNDKFYQKGSEAKGTSGIIWLVQNRFSLTILLGLKRLTIGYIHYTGLIV